MSRWKYVKIKCIKCSYGTKVLNAVQISNEKHVKITCDGNMSR